MIRVIIADDHELIRSGFSRLVAAEPDIALVGEARSAGELIQILRETTADILLLDINMPDRNGLDVLKDLRLSHPALKVLMLSMHPESRYAKRAMTDGAAGYLSKDSAADDLIAAIRQIHTHGRYISPALAQELAANLQKPSGQLPHSTLSDREYQLLILIGQGSSIRDASRQLGVTVNTAHTYRRRLLEKMGLQTDTDLVRYALSNQLVE